MFKFPFPVVDMPQVRSLFMSHYAPITFKTHIPVGMKAVLIHESVWVPIRRQISQYINVLLWYHSLVGISVKDSRKSIKDKANDLLSVQFETNQFILRLPNDSRQILCAWLSKEIMHNVEQLSETTLEAISKHALDLSNLLSALRSSLRQLPRSDMSDQYFIIQSDYSNVTKTIMDLSLASIRLYCDRACTSCIDYLKIVGSDESVDAQLRQLVQLKLAVSKLITADIRIIFNNFSKHPEFKELFFNLKSPLHCSQFLLLVLEIMNLSKNLKQTSSSKASQLMRFLFEATPLLDKAFQDIATSTQGSFSSEFKALWPTQIQSLVLA
jgi:hypothetical protein